MSAFRFVIFDLDGTLLNTLEDLAEATNWVCALHGWPRHPLERYKRFVGNGAMKLLERAAPGEIDLTDELHQQLYMEFSQRYNAHSTDHTAPYPGITELLKQLKDSGVVTGVLTNKPHGAAVPVVEHYFPGLLSFVQGALPGLPTKPDPTLLNQLLERLGAVKEETLFVGDSNVDIRTAKNGGLTGCGVLWGFRDREELEREGADHIVSDAEQLRTLILEGV